MSGANIAHASALGNVGGTKVIKDQWHLELRSGYSLDDKSRARDNQFELRQHMDYGFTDTYALRLVTTQSQLRGDYLQHNDIRIENRFHLIDETAHGWDGGVRLTYIHEDGRNTPHTLRARFTGQGKFSPRWTWFHNTLLAHDVGENAQDGLKLEFRSRATYATGINSGWLRDVLFGAEAINNIGALNDTGSYSEQRHQLGLMSHLWFDDRYNLMTVYRYGISDAAPDHSLTLMVGRMF